MAVEFMNIDIHTLSFIAGLTSTLQVLAIAYQYMLNKRLSGIIWWLIGFASIELGYGLLLLREIMLNIPITIVMTNIMFVLGLTLLYIGILRFLDRTIKRSFIVVIFAVSLIFLFYFSYVHDDITARNVITSSALAILSFSITSVLFVHNTKEIRTSAYLNALILFGAGCFFVFRAVMVGTVYPLRDYLAPTFMQTTAFLIPFTGSIMLTFGLIIMVNQRLSAESREARERFELIFNTSPDAVLITRLHDDCFIDINEGFTAMTGIARDEIIGRSSSAFNIWHDPADSRKLATILAEKGYYENLEAVFRRKDGSQFTGLVSARIITLNGVTHAISIARDITDRKLAEEEREKFVFELREALAQVKTLSGLLPVCSSCKRIKNDRGQWEQMEVYIRDRSEAQFSHGICPDCAKKLYPALYRKK